jgi:glycosyltransferase involved in cell wall biosynthesis
MRVLVINLTVDADDTVFGFTTAWITALAQRVEHVTVITMQTGRIALPDNVEVHSLRKERGYPEWRRLGRFWRLAWNATRDRRIDACFVHQGAVFAVLFAPIRLLRRVPIVLWYAHGHVPRTLRIAEKVVDRCVTSTPSGFKLATPKLRVLHQGIDTERFAPNGSRPASDALTAVNVGRISPSKLTLEVVDAVGLAVADGVPVRLTLIGGPATGDDQAYLDRIERRIADGLGEHVQARGPVPYPEIDKAYKAAAFFPSLSATASLDKTLLEAMACGCVPLSSNESFAQIANDAGLGALVCPPTAEGLADRLRWAASLTAAERVELSAAVRGVVERDHGLGALTDRIVGELRDVSRRP